MIERLGGEEACGGANGVKVCTDIWLLESRIDRSIQSPSSR